MWPKTIEVYSQLLWRPDLPDQVVSRAVLPSKALEENPSLPLSVSGDSSLCLSFCPLHFLVLCYQDT